jgi:hypothetical protein
MNICNSVDFYNMSAIGQVARVAMDTTHVHGTIYICNYCNYIVTISLQLICNLEYNYVVIT